jgi:hypothetical protein
MMGWIQISGSDCIVKGRGSNQCSSRGVAPELGLAFPWENLLADATICNIGGGKGYLVQQILREYPHLRAVVQDLNSVIEDARKVILNFHR